MNTLYVFLYTLIIVLLDSYCYGVIKQVYLDRANLPSGIFSKLPNDKIFKIFSSFWVWLFKDYSRFLWIKLRVISQTNYRVVQKTWEIGLAILVFYLTKSVIPVIAIIIGHVFTVYDYLFYVILGQLQLCKDFEDAYWLTHIWNIGKYLSPFNYSKFKICFFVGIILMILISLIKWHFHCIF